MQLAPVLRQFVWVFIADATGKPFVISDVAVSVVPIDEDGQRVMPAALGTPGVKLCFPLAPDLLLMMQEPSGIESPASSDGKCFSIIDTADIEALNELQTLACRQRIYSKTQDFEFAKQLVQDCTGLHQGKEYETNVSGPFTEGTGKNFKSKGKFTVQW